MPQKESMMMWSNGDMLKTDRKLIVWGMGFIGYGEIARLCVNHEIAFVVDRKIPVGESATFLGYDVYNPQEILSTKPGEYFIAITIDAFEQPCKWLYEHGFRFYDDFLPAANFDNPYININFFNYVTDNDERRKYIRLLARGRKTCMFYGDCHSKLLKMLFRTCNEFNEKYALIDVNRVIYNSNFETWQDFLMEKAVWQECDLLFAYRIMTKASGMFKYLQSTSRKIYITPAEFDGYFIQLGRKSKDEKMPWNNNINMGTYINYDRFIDRMVNDELADDEIINNAMDEHFLSDKDIQTFIDESLAKLELYEKKDEVKIADFIKENHRKKLLYSIPGHPKNELMLELARRILRAAGIEDVSDLSFDYIPWDAALRFYHIPIYPCVARYLGDEFAKSLPSRYYHLSLASSNGRYGSYSFEEYVRYYIKIAKSVMTHNKK